MNGPAKAGIPSDVATAPTPPNRGGYPTAEAFSAHAGQGVQAVVDGHLIVAGRAGWLESAWSVTVPPSVADELAAAEAAGGTAIVVAWDGEVRGIVVVADTVKDSSRRAVAELRRLGLTPVLLTGDNEGAARAVADQVVAMGGGTDAAIPASDITVVSGDLVVVADAIWLSRRTLGTIKGNLFWAFAYNVAAIPVAMLGLLNPLLAGAAMALSSVFVVTNSLRLRSFQPIVPTTSIRKHAVPVRGTTQAATSGRP
jgi:Cu+-exporting ATPase